MHPGALGEASAAVLEVLIPFAKLHHTFISVQAARWFHAPGSVGTAVTEV